jgi:GNAT superfamily N-acetyltransferase
MSIAIRAAVTDDVPAIASLIEAAYSAAMAQHFSAEGRDTFLKFAAPAAIAARFAKDTEAWVAVGPDRSVAGYAELDGDHLRMLFVRQGLQRSGIGRELMKFLQVLRSGRTVSLNSAPNADAFYLAMGFRPTGPRQESNGIVFTPMERKL